MQNTEIQTKKQDNHIEFNFKLDLLKEELNRINITIDKFDNIGQSTKYWAIVIFIGVSSAILGSKNEDINKLIVVSPLIPIVFWIIDSTWRRHQNRTIYRSQRISDFLNSDKFESACSNMKFIDFTTWDPMGNNYSTDLKYKRFTSFWRMFWFKTISRFYIGLIIIGLLVSLFTYWELIK